VSHTKTPFRTPFSTHNPTCPNASQTPLWPINFSHLTLSVCFKATFNQSDNQDTCYCHWTQWLFWIIVSSLGSHSFNYPCPIGHHRPVSFMFRVKSMPTRAS